MNAQRPTPNAPKLALIALLSSGLMLTACGGGSSGSSGSSGSKNSSGFSDTIAPGADYQGETKAVTQEQIQSLSGNQEQDLATAVIRTLSAQSLVRWAVDDVGYAARRSFLDNNKASSGNCESAGTYTASNTSVSQETSHDLYYDTTRTYERLNKGTFTLNNCFAGDTYQYTGKYETSLNIQGTKGTSKATLTNLEFTEYMYESTENYHHQPIDLPEATISGTSEAEGSWEETSTTYKSEGKTSQNLQVKQGDVNYRVKSTEAYQHSEKRVNQQYSYERNENNSYSYTFAENTYGLNVLKKDVYYKDDDSQSSYESEYTFFYPTLGAIKLDNASVTPCQDLSTLRDYQNIELKTASDELLLTIKGNGCGQPVTIE